MSTPARPIPDAALGALGSAAGALPRLLGWPGRLLPPTSLFATPLLPVITLDVAAHWARAASGDGPQLDPDVLAMWEWPEAAETAPPTVVRLSGVLILLLEERPSALARAACWRAFGPVAVLGPVLGDGELLDELTRHGVGALGPGLDGWKLLAPAVAGRHPPARRRTADRWIEETLYGQVLNLGLLDI